MSLASRRSISHQSTVRLGTIPKFRAGWYLEASIRLSKHALNRTLTSGFVSYGRSLADIKSDPDEFDDGLLFFYGGVLLLIVLAKHNRAEMLNSNRPCGRLLRTILVDEEEHIFEGPTYDQL